MMRPTWSDDTDDKQNTYEYPNHRARLWAMDIEAARAGKRGTGIEAQSACSKGPGKMPTYPEVVGPFSSGVVREYDVGMYDVKAALHKTSPTASAVTPMPLAIEGKKGDVVCSQEFRSRQHTLHRHVSDRADLEAEIHVREAYCEA